MKEITPILLLLIAAPYLTAQSKFLEKSCLQYSPNSPNECYEFQYTQVNNYLAHTMDPGEIGSSLRGGMLWVTDHKFLKSDTLFYSDTQKYYSKVDFTQNHLYVLPYGQNEVKSVSRLQVENYLVTTLAYTPIHMLNHFQDSKDYEIASTNAQAISYAKQVGEYLVSITLDKSSFQVVEITSLSSREEDDQFYGFGDVLDVYRYLENVQVNERTVPTLIIKDELNGRLSDTLHVKSVDMGIAPENLVIPPVDFQILDDTEEETDITVEKYSDNIYFVNLHHCGTRSLAVEFEDFFLVAEAPLNSRYGDQLINEVRKINPRKPIKYFAFGHFHPHYTGGIRPFVHKGAKILCLDQNQDYIQSIVDAAHTLDPDSLALEPQEVNFESIYQAKTISDGSYFMTMYHIGSKSNHTNDYLVYYFPKEKLVFQDDLVWIDENTTRENISPMTSGFYQAVKDLNLDVREVAQNWSVFDKSNKMIFDFTDIEKFCD